MTSKRGKLAFAVMRAVAHDPPKPKPRKPFDSREQAELRKQAARIRAVLATEPRWTPYVEFLRQYLTDITKELV